MLVLLFAKDVFIHVAEDSDDDGGVVRMCRDRGEALHLSPMSGSP